MDADDLFKDIHDMDKEQLTYFYKTIFNMQEEWFGAKDKGVGLWISIFLDGIFYECADRICGTNFNGSAEPMGITVVQ